MTKPFLLRRPYSLYLATYLMYQKISPAPTAIPLVLALLLSFCGLRSYGQYDLGQRKTLIDDNWRFHLGDMREASAVDYDDKSWQKLDLPHDWSIAGTAQQQHPSGNDGGYFPTGIGWYRKTIQVDSRWRNKNLSLYFGGVYMNAQVYINGKLAGGRPYGYSSFQVDITPYINYGAVNTIAIKVDNAQQKNSRWYSGSGIYRHVHLISTEKLHFTNWGSVVNTESIKDGQASIAIKTAFNNESRSERVLTLTYHILDRDKKVVAAEEERVNIKAQEKLSLGKTLVVKKANLWSPEQPHLYTALLSIREHKKVVDEIAIPFGIRTISYNTQQGFSLNGQPVKINGGCVHHDNGALGAAAYDRAEYRKAEILKKAGFNAVRTSHNPPSEAFLDACDELGLMVMDESFDGWRTAKNRFDYAVLFDEWWQQDVESMVLRDRNHPSIVFWSTGNEIIERKEPQAVTTANDLARAVRNIDPTRPVTSAITTWDNDWAIFDPLFAAHDIGGYNYQLHRAPSDHQRVPNRVMVQTESYPRDAFANWKLVNENPYIIGDFVWTAMDYLGESGIGRYYYKGETEGQHYDRDIFPWHGAYCGDIDLMGNRKPISHYRELLYSGHGKMYLAVKEPDHYFGEIKETIWSVWPTWESWTWPGHEGKQIEVEVYTKYPTVRLYLNERLLAEQEVSESTEFKASFRLPYQPGMLRAVALADGNEMQTQVLQTAGPAQHIALSPDRNQISADGQDLSFVMVELRDENAVRAFNADNRINFTIDGPGTILAVDNANLQDNDAYADDNRKAWKGRAMVVVKSQRNKGAIKLTATAEGLRPATTTIKTK